MHISVPVDSEMEIISSTQISPYVSKCVIKVCYIGENRNRTNISKEVALEMGRFLPGSPIVGFFNNEDKDYEEHNRAVQVDEDTDEVSLIDITKPYGFVPTDAKVWFQKFLDDNTVEREYLLTEGYIWTEIYPESKIITERGSNQSMELEKNSVKGYWAKSENSKNKFFIINEALIEKLCILGDKFEPCFEGAQIKTSFSLEQEFEELKKTMFSMINELKDYFDKGGNQTIMELENIVDNQEVEDKDFSLTETNESLDVKEDFAKEEEKEEDKEKEEKEEKEIEDKEEDKEDKEEDKEDKKDKKFSLEEVETELKNLQEKYSSLQQEYQELSDKFNLLNQEADSLKEFKLSQDRKDKQEMINSFYMLSDEDKADIIANIDNYSLEEIESKLAVICVRNKVNFNLESEDNKDKLTYNLDTISQKEHNEVSDWIKLVQETGSKM